MLISYRDKDTNRKYNQTLLARQKANTQINLEDAKTHKHFGKTEWLNEIFAHTASRDFNLHLTQKRISIESLYYELGEVIKREQRACYCLCDMPCSITPSLNFSVLYSWKRLFRLIIEWDLDVYRNSLPYARSKNRANELKFLISS